MVIYSYLKNNRLTKRCSIKPSTEIDPTNQTEVTISDTTTLQKTIDNLSKDKELQKKRYIRSLSLANDPSAEPHFLNSFKTKATAIKNSLAFIDENHNYTGDVNEVINDKRQ